MLAHLARWLFGGCARCEERAARITALERQLNEALDRVMSRDYSHVAFVRQQTAALATTGQGETRLDFSEDGLDA